MLTNARIISDTSESEYRAKSAWSVSQFKILPYKVELFYGFYIASPPLFEFDETAGVLFGINCHAEFLEGRKCSQVPPEVLTCNGQRRGKAWDAYKATHGALECLSAKEIAAVQGIRASCEAQPLIANLLWGEGKTELPIFAHDEESGLDVKGKLDKLRVTPGGRILGDLKISALDVDDDRAIKAQIFAMGYMLQLAFYADLIAAAFGEPPVSAVIIFCRNKPPYTARAWQANENDLDWGRRRVRTALDDLRRRLDSGDWTGSRHNQISYGEDNSLLPKWAWTDGASDLPSSFEEFTEFAIQ
jgi:hypothetical protein